MLLTEEIRTLSWLSKTSDFICKVDLPLFLSWTSGFTVRQNNPHPKLWMFFKTSCVTWFFQREELVFPTSDGVLFSGTFQKDTGETEKSRQTQLSSRRLPWFTGLETFWIPLRAFMNTWTIQSSFELFKSLRTLLVRKLNLHTVVLRFTHRIFRYRKTVLVVVCLRGFNQ